MLSLHKLGALLARSKEPVVIRLDEYTRAPSVVELLR